MYAAAEGHSTIGIPESVGKKFVAHRNDELANDAKFDKRKKEAAGVIHYANGKILLIKRGSKSATYPSTWAFPGGKIDNGESPLQAATRESFEEVGYSPSSALSLGSINSAGVKFHSFFSKGPQFDVTINDESEDYGWFDINRLPDPMIPSCRDLLSLMFPDADDRTEFHVMEQIRDKHLPSPQKVGNVHLFAIRVTGTGIAVRGNGEVAHRSPADYLNNEFLQRCNGLPVIWEHPDDKLLDSESFRKQIVGTSSLPYIEGDEVWTIARIYDDSAAELMSKRQLSTSPAVRIGKGSHVSGDILLESKPSFTDHIAICSVGVWDKSQPDGVRIDSMNEVSKMDEETLKAIKEMFTEHSTKMDSAIASISDRLDSLESVKADAKEDKDDSCGDAKADAKHEDEAEDKKLIKEEIAKAKADSDDGEVKDDSKHDEETNKMDSKEDDKVKDDSFKADAMSEITALKAQLEELRSKTAERSVDDSAELARIQSRADSVAMALGDTQGISPLLGESVMGYRKRLASRFAKFSDRFKSVDIGKISDVELFKPVEEAIYADSMAYAKAPPIAEGHVHLIESRDEAGRMVRTPSTNSDPRGWMNGFSNGAVFSGSIRV